MRRWAVLALFVCALGALLHFWPQGDGRPARSATNDASYPGSVVPSPSSPTQEQRVAASTLASQPQADNVERQQAGATRFDIRAPSTVRPGDTFPVTIEIQAPRAIRQLVFSVTYRKQILQLVGSSPGMLGQQGGAALQFEEVSDGSVLVRFDRALIAGAGSLAVLEFQALRSGVSPLAVVDVTYVEDGRQETTAAPTAREGSIAVE